MYHRFQKLILVMVLFVSQGGLAKGVLIPKKSIKKTGPRYFVVGIGVNSYKDSFWLPLKWAKKDAIKVTKAFGQGTRYSVQSITLTNKKATLKNVRRTLGKIKKTALQGDTVVIYFSGHGTLFPGRSGELEQVVVLYDTLKTKLQKTGLFHSELINRLENIKARRKLLIFATCHGGVGKSRLSPQVKNILNQAKGENISLADVSEGMLVLGASTKGEAARETDKLGGDIYTHFLLEALSVYDRNKDGVISALEAHDYSRQKTFAYTGGRQRPTARSKSIGQGTIPLKGRPKRKGKPILEAYNESLSGFSLQVEKGGKGTLPLAFPLKEGTTKVKLYRPSSNKPIAIYEIKASSGETIEISDVLKAPPYFLALGDGMVAWDNFVLKPEEFSPGQGITLVGGFNHQEWAFGPAIDTSVSQTSELAPNLELSHHHFAYGIQAAYQYPLNFRTRFEGGLGLGLASINIDIKDNLDTSIKKSSSSIYQEAFVGTAYRITSSLWLSLRGGSRWVKWDFQELGELDGNSKYLKILFEQRLGGSSRRVK